MKTMCAACGREVVASSGAGGKQACPECGAPMDGAAPAARAAMPPLRARDPEIRRKHSVEAGAVFSKSIKVFVANIVPFLAVTAVVFSPSLLYGAFHASRPLEEITSASASDYGSHQDLLQMLLRTLVSAAIVSSVFQHLRDKPVTTGSALSGGLARVLPALWTGILVGIAYVGPMLPGILLTLGEVGGTSTSTLALGGLLTLVGGIFSLVIITGLYVAIPASVVEKVNGFAALKRSWALTKGSKGQIFVILLAVGILGMIAGFIIPRLGGYRTQVTLSLGLAVTGACFSGVFAGVVYYNLRAVKEGIGIEELAKVFD